MDDLTTKILHASLLWLSRILLPAWLIVPCSELLQRHHLVCTQECHHRESRKSPICQAHTAYADRFAVWSFVWSGSVSRDV